MVTALKRVLRLVDDRAPARSTSSTGTAAAARCHALGAVVGEPSKVWALAATSLGASSVPTEKPMTTAIAPSAADSIVNTAVTWRGVNPTAFRSPISRCCAAARAPTRIATTADTTASSTSVYIVRMIVSGWASRSAFARWSFQVSTSPAPGGTKAAARAAKAAAVEGSARRMGCVHSQRLRSGSTCSSVARVTQARPGLRRG